MQIQGTFWSIGGEVGQGDKGTRGQGDKEILTINSLEDRIMI